MAKSPVARSSARGNVDGGSTNADGDRTNTGHLSESLPAADGGRGQEKETQENSPVRSVERVLDLLTALSTAEHPPGLAELSRATGIHAATAQRLLNALERRGFVQKERKRYQIGPAIIPLASAFLTGNTLTRAALPLMEELVVATGETSSLYIRHGFDRILILRVDSPHLLRFITRVGERLPLYTGAAGRVLLAAMPEPELTRYLDLVGEVRFATGKTMSKDAIRARLEQVREQGFVVSRDERFLGVVSVGAPVIVPPRGVIAAVTVSAPNTRLNDEQALEVSVEVRRAAMEIARRYRSL